MGAKGFENEFIPESDMIIIASKMHPDEGRDESVEIERSLENY